jgi:hypothetical protein
MLAADVLQAADSTLTTFHAACVISDLLTLFDSGQKIEVSKIADTLAMTDVSSSKRTAFPALFDSLVLTDVSSAGATFLLSTTSELHLADAISSLLHAKNSVIDTIFFGGRVTLDGEDYTTYAVSVENAAVSEYAGWKFNSFAVIGGRAYGAAEDGIHLLEGDTDDGEQIDASVRVGLSNLGTALYKAVPYGYIGYTSTGALLLKVITSDRGVKKENWYSLSAIPRGSDANARFAPRKGLQSVYWDFEVANIAGADFELDFVKVYRMALTRRKK